MLLTYVALTAAFAWRFRREIVSSRFAPLLVGVAFFAASIAVDVALESRDFTITVAGDALAARNLVEDGFQLLGIVSWCGYRLTVSWSYLLERFPSASRT